MKDGMVLDFADLKGQIRAVLARYDHRHWNEFMDYPTVENICERLATEIAADVTFPFSIRVFEGHAKWAETDRGAAGDTRRRGAAPRRPAARDRPALGPLRREDPLAREGLEPRGRLARLHAARPLHGARLDRVDAGLPVRLGASCSSTRPATARSSSSAASARYARMAPHVTPRRACTTTASTTSAPTATCGGSSSRAATSAEGRERDLCELALKVTGAVQAARWTRTADGGGFIYSFNGPHSLFVDTMRSLRSLALAHRLGHALMGEGDRPVSLLERLVLARAHHRALQRLLRRGPRRLRRARPRGAREPLQRGRRQLPLPEHAAGLLAVHDLDARAGLGAARLRRGAGVPGDRSPTPSSSRSADGPRSRAA